jgi:hypothetical protein
MEKLFFELGRNLECLQQEIARVRELVFDKIDTLRNQIDSQRYQNDDRFKKIEAEVWALRDTVNELKGKVS